MKPGVYPVNDVIDVLVAMNPGALITLANFTHVEIGKRGELKPVGPKLILARETANAA